MKSADQEFVIIGRILSPRGNSGQVRVSPETDFPQRFDPGARVFVDRQPLAIEDAHWHHGKPVVKFTSIDRVEDARKLQGKFIEIPQSEVQTLEEDRYYYFQLIGLKVRTEQDELLGQLTEILALASNDVYVVQGPRGEILIPAIADVVKKVDLKRKLMIVQPLDGLLELNRKKTDRPAAG
jgi:16S rRNA processing protein RimM